MRKTVQQMIPHTYEFLKRVAECKSERESLEVFKDIGPLSIKEMLRIYNPDVVPDFIPDIVKVEGMRVRNVLNIINVTVRTFKADQLQKTFEIYREFALTNFKQYQEICNED